MEGDPPVRMEVEVDALMAVETDLYFNANDFKLKGEHTPNKYVHHITFSRDDSSVTYCINHIYCCCGVRRDPKVLRRVSRILNKEGLHFANLFYIFE